ncbi:MAG TPA: glycoside hydrolase family 43 protein [Pyrinomonadaceae bacterium]|nr:glycoside hydrolase family 43 protein [Pyrinomonadaceae bacterium]
MSADLTNFTTETYLNPVYPHSFPDPFVLKFRGEYFAYCTDFWRDGRVFGVLRSRDLVNWTEVGGALQKLETDAPFYWAPEVTYANGKFYLYYSVGNEALMELRVAVSDRPEGGFVDSGKKLSTEDFAIDAHVFTDTDGQKYLFYATDFLRHSHIGTGTVVDKMTDFYTLEGNPRPVTRARFDWQVYDPNRKEKGGVRWHTVEGAFVLKRKGIYYEMFSGGNWQNITYGVSFAVTDDIERDEEWAQFSDGEKVLPILRTIPDLVVGPGHNSVIRGINNRELYCVYHRWTENGRTLAIDRMDFAAQRIFIKGATNTPQIAPFKPVFADFFDGETLNENWQSTGDWKISNNEIINEFAEESHLQFASESKSFLCEVYLRAIETAARTSAFGFSLFDETGETFKFLILPDSNLAVIYGTDWTETFELPEDFEASAFHLLRVEYDARVIKISLDEANFRFEKSLKASANSIVLVAENMRAGFSAFTLTKGFEDLFDWQDAEIERRGWQKSSEAGDCHVKNGELFLSNKTETDAILTKGEAAENFEFAVNLRLTETFGENTASGFLILNYKDEEIYRLALEGEPGNFYLSIGGDLRQKFSLPEGFAPENYHQFRFLKLNEELFLQLEDFELGAISLSEGKTRIALFCRNSGIALETVRLTIL